MQQQPGSVTVTLGLVLLGGVTWLVFGILLALYAHPGFPDKPAIRGLMALLSVAAGCAVLVLLIFLKRRHRLAFFALLAVLAAASLAIFLDDVGIIDLVVLAVFIIPLALLIKDRAWYMRN